MAWWMWHVIPAQFVQVPRSKFKNLLLGGRNRRNGRKWRFRCGCPDGYWCNCFNMLLCCKFGMNCLIAQRLCKEFLSGKLELTGCQLFLCKMHDTLKYISDLFCFVVSATTWGSRIFHVPWCCMWRVEVRASSLVAIWFSLPTLTSTESDCCRKLSILQEFRRKKQWVIQVSSAKPFPFICIHVPDQIVCIHVPDQIDVSACRGCYSITRICWMSDWNMLPCSRLYQNMFPLLLLISENVVKVDLTLKSLL